MPNGAPDQQTAVRRGSLATWAEQRERSRRLRLADYRVSGEELRWAVLVAGAVMAATLVPYLLGVLICPPTEWYSGLLGNPDDQNVYLSWMKQAEQGHWRFADQFTPEPHPALFFHAFFLGLGLVCRLVLAPSICVYHAARVVSGMALLVAVYLLAAQFTPQRGARRLAVWLAATSSGLGWLFYLVAPGAPVHPVDFGPHLTMPEAITFPSLLLNPLFTFSMWLLAGLLLNLVVWWRTGRRRYLVVAAGCSLVLGNVHSYDLLAVAGTLVLYLAVRTAADRKLPLRQAVGSAIVMAAALPGLGYQYYYWAASPLLRSLREVAPTLTPAPGYVLAGYGLLLVLAAGGALRVGKERGEALLLVAWPVASLALAVWGPWSFQRKLVEGVHLPLVVLGAMGIARLVRGLPARAGGLAATLLVVAMVPSNLCYLAQTMDNLVINNSNYVSVLMPPVRYSAAQVEAMDWLGRNAGDQSVVLCSPFVGNLLPRRAGVRVFVGHWCETVDFAGKLRALVWYWSLVPGEQERLTFLRQWGVGYIFVGPYERSLGAYRPGDTDVLTRVFDNGEVTIFRVEPLHG